jgi:hypothetical protein
MVIFVYFSGNVIPAHNVDGGVFFRQ